MHFPQYQACPLLLASPSLSCANSWRYRHPPPTLAAPPTNAGSTENLLFFLRPLLPLQLNNSLFLSRNTSDGIYFAIRVVRGHCDFPRGGNSRCWGTSVLPTRNPETSSLLCPQPPGCATRKEGESCCRDLEQRRVGRTFSAASTCRQPPPEAPAALHLSEQLARMSQPIRLRRE